MAQALLAAIGLAVCLVLIVRLLLPKPRQWRFDAAVRRGGSALRMQALRLWHWRRHRSEAARVARDAIDRASGRAGRPRADGEWKGNVYESKSFRKRRKPH